MAEEQELTGWERSRAAQKGYGKFYAGLAIATVFIAGVWIGSRVFTDSTAFGMNLWTEALGMLITVGLFGLISKHLDDERYKEQLVDEAASPSNEIAKHAIHTIRRKEWLEANASILRGQNLSGAQLEKIDLSDAGLQGTRLDGANLHKAFLHETVLTEASLRNANLQGAHLLSVDLRNAFLSSTDLREATITGSRLQHAKMVGAKLQKADLTYANLQNAVMESSLLHGANLSGANLQGARLKGAVFNEETIFDGETVLPDGTYWSEGRDLEQFTDRTHPDFQWHYSSPK